VVVEGVQIRKLARALNVMKHFLKINHHNNHPLIGTLLFYFQIKSPELIAVTMTAVDQSPMTQQTMKLTN
jgi:hypothetical protein